MDDQQSSEPEPKPQTAPAVEVEPEGDSPRHGQTSGDHQERGEPAESPSASAAMEQLQRSQVRSSRVVAVATVLYLIATILLWIETHRAVNITRESLEFAKAGAEEGRKQAEADRELTRRSVEATETALALTEESNRLTARGIDVSQQSLAFSREALRVAERPWVVASVGNPSYVLSADEPSRVTIQFTNTGRSPAVNIWAELKGMICACGTGDLGSAADSVRLERDSTGVLGPGRNHELSLPVPAQGAEGVEEILSGKVDLLAFGTYSYETGFDSTRHSLKFCFRFNPEIETGRSAPSTTAPASHRLGHPAAHLLT